MVSCQILSEKQKLRTIHKEQEILVTVAYLKFSKKKKEKENFWSYAVKLNLLNLLITAITEDIKFGGKLAEGIRAANSNYNYVHFQYFRSR